MRLWFDTNALWRKASELRAITELARAKGLTPVASAQVYLEDRRQTHIRRGRGFAAAAFDAGFAQLFDVIDVPFDRATAARWADLLADRYPDRDAWRNATLATIGGQLRAQLVEPPARVPMTTDWWIALAVEEDPESRVVFGEAGESGEEWRTLRESGRALRWEAAIEWLEGIADIAS